MRTEFSMELQHSVFFRDGDIAYEPGPYDLVIVTSCMVGLPESKHYTKLNLGSDKQWYIFYYKYVSNVADTKSYLLFI